MEPNIRNVGLRFSFARRGGYGRYLPVISSPHELGALLTRE